MTACDFIFNDGTKQQVTAREGKPILIVEEGDTETCKWAEHSLEVTSYTSLDPDNLDCQPCLKEKVQNIFCPPKVPRAVDALQGVLTVIPLQLLSYHLAVLR